MTPFFVRPEAPPSSGPGPGPGSGPTPPPVPPAPSTGVPQPSGPGGRATPALVPDRVVATQPADIPPATRPATTAPVAAQDRGDATPDDVAPEDGGRRRRWPWVVAVAAVLVVVVAVVLAALLGTPGSRPGASVPGSTASPEAGGGSATTSEAGAGSDSALAGGPEDQARQQAIIDYYGLLPNQLDEGWQRLTPSFRSSTAGGIENYRSFWATIQQVTVRGVSPAGGDEVDATVTYRYADGREVDERTVFRLAFVDGIWKIDGQRQAN